MTFEDALAKLDMRQRTFPQNQHRLGWALHSETLTPLELRPSTRDVWEAHYEPLNKFGDWQGWQAHIPASFYTQDGSDFSGHILKHRKGNVYCALAKTLFEGEMHGVYFKEDAPDLFWIRPFDMFEPSRFEKIGTLKEWPL